jgi:SAM-dependent methyltransferase
MTFWLVFCGRLAIATAVGIGVLAACRWLRRQSPMLAAIVVAGLLLRAGATLFLFWTSYLDLPILRGLHNGDGFWTLAVDARLYYDLALDAANNGFVTISRGSASPAFVKILALWMRAVGLSPASGAYLNLALYVLLCVTIVAAFRPDGRARTDLPCALTLFGLSFSPVLVIHSSQPLKDATAVFLIGLICLTAAGFLPVLTRDDAPGGSRARAVGLGAIFLAAIYIIAGIRGYYAAIVWSALAVVLFVWLWGQRRARLAPYAAVSVLLLAAGWMTYEIGADLDYINPYATAIDAVWARARPAKSPDTVVAVVDRFRTGFEQSPGATSVRPVDRSARGKKKGGPGPAAPAAAPSRSVQEGNDGPNTVTRGAAVAAPAGGLSGRLSALTIGLGLIFVPISLLRALSIVDFAGGRGLLAITDVDTLFMDLAIAAVIAVIVRRWPALRGRLSYVGFAALLAAATAALMAYVVTNFGTLFRLRLMVAVPLWMLPLALSARRGAMRPGDGSALAEDVNARLAARTRASFGYEWSHFHQWQDSSERSFRDYFETADLDALRGRRVLDAGCGMGRHARQMAAHARQVVTVDFSRAIQQAATNTRGIDNIACVQADLLHLPFADATFDYIYSLGVLHHLGNTEAAVRSLVATLKPGGRLRVYVYWKRHGGTGALLRMVNALRPVTTRLPFALLRWLCWIVSAALWLTVILPYRLLTAAGVRGMATWPLFVYTQYPFRIVYNDQFDRFSAPLEKRYDPNEVTALLESGGLRDVRLQARFGWIAEGVKPEIPAPCAE